MLRDDPEDPCPTLGRARGRMLLTSNNVPRHGYDDPGKVQPMAWLARNAVRGTQGSFA